MFFSIKYTLSTSLLLLAFPSLVTNHFRGLELRKPTSKSVSEKSINYKVMISHNTGRYF